MKLFPGMACAVGLCYALPAQAWDFSGHFVVAEIAYQHLEPATKTQADSLIAELESAEPRTRNFVQASAWLDAQSWVKGFQLMNSWHYSSQAYSPVAMLLPAAEGDLLKVTQQAIQTLQDPQSTRFQKGLMLRVLIHTLGDLHQPLHSISYFSAAFPQGDLGGYRFELAGPYPNLHRLWDAAAGRLPYLQWTQAAEAASWVKTLSPTLKAQEAVFQDRSLDPQLWLQQSHQLAIDLAYPGLIPAQHPDVAYLKKVQTQSEQLFVIAGLRLAALLNQSLKADAKAPSRL